MVQGLRLCAPKAGDQVWIPGQGTRSYVVQLNRCSQIKIIFFFFLRGGQEEGQNQVRRCSEQGTEELWV